MEKQVTEFKFNNALLSAEEMQNLANFRANKNGLKPEEKSEEKSEEIENEIRKKELPETGIFVCVQGQKIWFEIPNNKSGFYFDGQKRKFSAMISEFIRPKKAEF